jgi:hypothetical protein
VKTWKEILIEGKSTAVLKQKNLAGTVYILAKLATGNFVVYKRKENYVRGKMASSLAFVTPRKMSNQEGQKYAREGIPELDAMALFNKKIKGKSR